MTRPVMAHQPPSPGTAAPDAPTPAAVERVLVRAGRIAGWSVAALGALVLLAWFAGWTRLTRLDPAWATMKVNTALCFAALGASLALGASRTGRVLAGGAALLAALSLLEYGLGRGLGIDELLVADPLSPPGEPAGRMSVGTAICLLLQALAQSTRVLRAIPALLGAGFVLLAALLAICVYMFDVQALYQVDPFSTMAMHTALALAVLAGATLFRLHGGEVVWLIRSGLLSGIVLRRLLPAALLVPIALGWLCNAAVEAGVIRVEFALGALATFTALAGLATLVLVAHWTAGSERARRRSEDRMRAAFESSLVPTLVVDAAGVVQTSNHVAQQLFGYSAAEFRGLPVDRLVPAGLRAGHARLRSHFAAAPTARPMGPDRELRACRKDGSEFPVEIGLNPLPTSDRLLVVATIVDITRRLESEQALRDNELRLSLVLEATRDAIWDCDLSSRRVWWNPAACALLGRPPGQSDGPLDWWLERVHPDHRERVTATLDAAIRGDEQRWSAEYRFRRDDGETLHLLDRVRIARDPAGQAIRLVGAIQDQTLEEQAKAQLREAATRARAMADQAPMMMWLSNADGAVEYANRAWVAFTGRTPEDARGAGWLDRVHPEDRAQVAADFQAALERQDAFTHEYRLADVQGRYHWTLWHGLPMQSDGGGFAGYIGCGVEIDEMKQSLDRLARSNEELEHFAYVASHDLQEPLRMVSSFCQLLEERYADKLDSDGREFVNFAVDGARRMQQLIQDLLQYSRAGRPETTFRALSADAACEQALRQLNASIVETRARIERTTLPEVMANESQLILVFQNLIGNALKFHGEAPPVVQIDAEPEGAGWRISVRDNGIGIEDRHFERIFGVFQRLHSRGQFPGSGIGLAICKKIVDTHGGAMRVESTVGTGSTFSFWLPGVESGAASAPDAVVGGATDAAPGGDPWPERT